MGTHMDILDLADQIDNLRRALHKEIITVEEYGYQLFKLKRNYPTQVAKIMNLTDSEAKPTHNEQPQSFKEINNS